MSKIVVIEHLTLDGVYQGPGRPDEDRRHHPDISAGFRALIREAIRRGSGEPRLLDNAEAPVEQAVSGRTSERAVERLQ